MFTLDFRIALLAVAAVAALASPAAAQAPTGQAPPCANDFVPLRTAVEKDGELVKSAISRKAPREEVCNRLKRFVATEDKFVKYIVENQGWCGIPQQAIAQVTASHQHSTKLRNQACSGGGGGPAIPAGPGLSEALGTSRVPTANTTKSGAGTFDTLSGNPLR